MNNEHQYLAELLPKILEEGPVLIKFKTNNETTIRPDVIITLHTDECPIDSKPDDDSKETLWGWDLFRETWVLIDLEHVDIAEIWPPHSEDNETTE